MPARRPSPRFASAATLAGVLLFTATACNSSPSPEPAKESGPATTWQEPASYAYTLTSTTQVMAGTFRVDVRDGKVTKTVGLDADSRRQVRDLPRKVPTIGELLKTLGRARSEGAATAEADYAADGHPVRITLDWDENAIDDEALYVIDSYRPNQH
ncbi:DUF6174 domain-containing protein [Streptomyces pseudovenezuelae]|uniref:DUF6174 domain-containing protein n=1 Tax=Streptomyces pseudovenezuelae TaxID=67350 RepID=UPI0036E60AC6